MKLSDKQIARLAEIRDYEPTEELPLPGFFPQSKTDQSLARRGLVERIEHETTLGGITSPVSRIKVAWHLCKLTNAGRMALNKHRSKDT